MDFKSIIAEYGPLLSRVASSYEANPELRKELLQEISIAVWLALEKYKGQSQLKTYILRIAHNRAVSHIAKEVRSTTNYASQDENAVELLVSDENPECQTLKSNQLHHLMQAVRMLPLQSRQIFTLSMEGLNYKEISDITGLSQSNVGANLSRSKTKILQEMQDANN